MRLTTDDVNTYIIMQQSFSAIRVMNDNLSPVMFELEVTLISDMRAGKTPEESSMLAGIGFRKLKTWLEIVLSGILIVKAGADLADVLLDETENTVMLTPDEPDDVIIAALLLTKMQAIAEGQLVVDSVSLSSSDTGFTKRIMRNQAIKLPGIEYLGVEAIHNKPWWLRDTIETIDYPKDSATEEYFAEISVRDPLKELDRELRGDQEADVISLDTWKTEKPH